jgi:hypothetical protein
MAKLPTPPQVYDADIAWVEHRPGDVRLFFGKLGRDEPNSLRTRLELRYPVENLANNFWPRTRDFHTKMKDFADKWPKDELRAKLDPAQMHAGKEHSEWANFETMAHAGTEAMIDFYMLPASGVAKFAQGQGSSGLTLVPIVRIQMTIFELTRLLGSLEPIVAEIEKYLPAREALTPRLERNV